MGIIDVKFNKINTNLAISCLDSTIKIYDIDTSNISIKDRVVDVDIVPSYGELEGLVHWQQYCHCGGLREGRIL